MYPIGISVGARRKLNKSISFKGEVNYNTYYENVNYNRILIKTYDVGILCGVSFHLN